MTSRTMSSHTPSSRASTTSLALVAGETAVVRVRDGRRAAPLPYVLAAPDHGGAPFYGSIDGRLSLAHLRPGHHRLTLFKTGFEAETIELTIAAPAAPATTDAPPGTSESEGDVCVGLRPSSGAIAVFFFGRSPRRHHGDPVSSASAYGEFCNWDVHAHPLTPHPDVVDLWRARIELPPSARMSDVRFFLNDALREEDPDHAWGGRGMGYAQYLERRPAERPEAVFVAPASGAVVEPGWLACDVLVSPPEGAADGALDGASIRLDVDGAEVVPAELVLSTDGLRARFRVELPERGEYSLTFVARDAGGRDVRAWATVWATRGEVPSPVAPIWADATPSRSLEPPDWLRDAIFYHVHTRVFAPDATRAPGTFRGVMDRLDYLADLGINAIQFMPLFDGPSNHGYVSESFFRVERDFGTNEEFRALVEAAHARGIRVVLDYSDTATQTSHPLFGRAVSEPDHPLRSFLRWRDATHYGSYSVQKDTVNGSWPQFDFEHPAVREYTARMILHWMRGYGVDGFRLDSVERVKPFPSHEWWRILRRAVKGACPEGLLYGEVYGDLAQFLGDQLDMGYDWEFNEAFREGVRDEDVKRIAPLLERTHRVDPSGRRYLRFFSNHDEDRMLSVFGGDRRKGLLAIAALMTLPGVPMLYYGEEVAMAGEGLRGRNSNRQPMAWSEVGGAYWQEVRRLTRLRASEALLRNEGEFAMLATRRPRRTLAWWRATAERAGGRPRDAFLVALNVSGRERRLKLREAALERLRSIEAFEDVLAPERGPVSSDDLRQDRLVLAPFGYRVLRAVR